jgi:hypothetical protein
VLATPALLDTEVALVQLDIVAVLANYHQLDQQDKYCIKTIATYYRVMLG